MGPRSTRVEAVKGSGNFPILWIADNRLKTVKSLLLKGLAVYFVFTKLTAVVWRDKRDVGMLTFTIRRAKAIFGMNTETQ